MKRLAERKLVKWLNSKYRKPLIVWGARKVGKTYLVKEWFAEKYFKDNYVYIDFNIEKDIRDYCQEIIVPKKIMEFISATKNIKIKEDTLLIFDEVQECLPIITALKYFCQDCRYQPVIATGLMIQTKIKRTVNSRGKSNNRSFLYPVGKIDQIFLYPLNFQEFFINYNEKLYNVVCDAYKNRQKLDILYHEKAKEILYKYLLIGGMPEAVDVFLETDSYYESREVLKVLYDNYLADMALYQASPESIIRSKKIFEMIYQELNKENKNFSPSNVEKGAKNRDLSAPIDWLTTALLVHKSYLVKERVTTPLIPEENGNYRLYLSDVGIFAYQSGLNSANFLISEKYNTLSGIFIENYVANEIIAKGLKLYYWKGKGNAEFEFLLELNGNVYPLDAKKGRKGLNSVEKYRNHNPKNYIIKISDNNYGIDKENMILTIPLYQTFLLLDEFVEGTFNL